MMPCSRPRIGLPSGARLAAQPSDQPAQSDKRLQRTRLIETSWANERPNKRCLGQPNVTHVNWPNSSTTMPGLGLDADKHLVAGSVPHGDAYLQVRCA